MAKVSVDERDNEEIRNVSDLLLIIKKLRDSTEEKRICFRGHGAIKWKLIPPVGRPRYFGDETIEFSEQEEERLLDRFRRAGYLRHQRILTHWETMILGRHHGLPVRLLDWTFNPLAALYFACESVFKERDQQTDGALWALVPKPIDEKTYYNLFDQIDAKPLKVQGVKLIYPFHISERINAQTSVFTIQEDPKTPLEKYEWDSRKEEDVDVISLIRWKIKSTSMPAIVADLERVDVNKRTLFPDFDGLAGGLSESETIKKAKV